MEGDVGVGALYLHVPFCLAKCRYCDFASWTTRHGDASMHAYAGSLTRLVDEARELGFLDACRTAYVGGGTPTMLAADDLAAVVHAAAEKPGLDELTVEANPESLSDEMLAAVREAGATRVSIGVQSFDDHELRALGRVHTSELARERVSAAVASGLRVSIDLMCGIPYQTQTSWERSLQTAVDLGVGHVSCYPLMIEPGTAMERLCDSGKLPWPDDDIEADDMETAERVLGAAGLTRYEVASYARPGQSCAHNIAYWTGVPYLGLGVNASSMLDRAEYERLACVATALPSLQAHTIRARLRITSETAEVTAAHAIADLAFELEELTEREAVAEDLMLTARMSRGLSAELIGHAREVIGKDRVDRCLDRLVEESLLEPHADGSFSPTHSGWLMGNVLYGELWGLASA